MSFFSSLNKGNSSIKPATTQIRRVAAPSSKKPKPKPDNAPTRLAQKPAKSKSTTPVPASSRPAPRHPDPPREPVDKVDKSRAAAVRNGVKRKSHSPTVVFGSDSEGDSDDGIKITTSKKARISNSPAPDLDRQLRDTQEYDDGGVFPLIHGGDLTSSPDAKGYISAFRDSEGILEVKLEYPSASQPERFQLVIPTGDAEGYAPVSDIIDTVEHVCTHYFPAPTSAQLLDSSTGLPYRLRRAYNHQSSTAFLATIADYNTHVATARAAGTLHPPSTTGRLPLPLVAHILSQVYARTVSPRVEILRRYKNGEDNVYGELLAPLAAQIFRDTRLTSASTLLDLGSGVGNVVLQAALEVGCAAHGVEIMPNPCLLATAQRAEFAPRCRMWGLAPGATQLLQGDFLEDARTARLLRTADVILVNNQAFNPELNAKLVTLLLDAKEGARIVSLKSFVPPGFRLTLRTMGNPVCGLDVVRREYWSGGVSWTDQGGAYFVATKDSRRLEAFQEEVARGRAR